MNKGKGFIVLLFAFVLLASALTYALPNVEYIKINGDKYVSGDNLEVEKGDTLDFRVKLSADQDEKDIELRVYLAGYEYSDHYSLSDSTHVFDMDANTTSYKDLSIKLPSNLDVDKDYDVKMTIDASEGAPEVHVFPISAQSARHSLSIKDVIFSPENEVMAGRAMLATVRVENNGDRDEDSIKVSVRIPALGVSASDYIDELDEGDEITSEELYLRIPSCTEGGVYTAEIEVTYDDGYETITRDSTIKVVEDETCYAAPTNNQKEEQPEKTIISVGSTDMDVVKGEGGVVYPITVTNSGSKTKTYAISVDGTSGWGTIKVTPSNVMVIAPGETKAVYIYLSATETASAGQRMFSIDVSSDGKVLKQIPMTANIAQGEATESVAGWDQVKRGLEVGLIVLVVLLVLLGLIVGFNKLKGDKDEDDQTYY